MGKRAITKRKPKTPHKPARRVPQFYTPEAKRHRVIARRIVGQTQVAIARDEGLDRETVCRILSSAEAQELTGLARSALAAKFPQLAEKMLRIALRGRGDRQAITDIFRGLQVFQSREHHEVSMHDEFTGRTNDELRHFIKHGEWPGERKAARPG